MIFVYKHSNGLSRSRTHCILRSFLHKIPTPPPRRSALSFLTMEKFGGQMRELAIVGLSHVSDMQQTSMLLHLMSAHNVGKASGLTMDLAFNTREEGIRRGGLGAALLTCIGLKLPECLREVERLVCLVRRVIVTGILSIRVVSKVLV